VGGCGGGSGNSNASEDSTTTTTLVPMPPASEFEDKAGSADVALTVIDNTFEQKYVTVTVGSKVTWTNNGDTQHNITPVVGGAFPSVAATDFKPGATHTVTFDKPGDYPYYCTLHGTPRNGQNGIIRVVPA